MAQKVPNKVVSIRNASKNAAKPKKRQAATAAPLPIPEGSKDGLDEIRVALDPMDRYAFDKCMEALDTPKALTKWPDFIRTMQDLARKARMKSAENIDICFDTVSIAEAESA